MRNGLFSDFQTVMDMCLISIIVGIVFFIVLRILKESRRCTAERARQLRIIAIMALAVYLVVVFYATLACRSQFSESRSSEIFSTFIKAYDGYPGAQKDIILNLLFFMPFGFLLQFLGEKKMRWYIAIPLMCLYSCCIETIQFFTKLGVSQIDDVICNTLSGTAGYILACGLTDMIRHVMRK